MSKVMGPGEREGAGGGGGGGGGGSSPDLTVMTLRSKTSSRSSKFCLLEIPASPSASWSGMLHHDHHTSRKHDDVDQKRWT